MNENRERIIGAQIVAAAVRHADDRKLGLPAFAGLEHARPIRDRLLEFLAADAGRERAGRQLDDLVRFVAHVQEKHDRVFAGEAVDLLHVDLQVGQLRLALLRAERHSLDGLRQ